jgi:release factor glutamine methyltransferase
MQHMQIPAQASVLELGTGTGVIAAGAARIAGEVSATDISPYAIQCARATMRLNDLEQRVELLLGDLFTPVRGRRFDVILFSLPYLARTAANLEAMAWCAGPKCELVDRFLAEARGHLKADGSIQILFSSAAPVTELVAMIRRHGYYVHVLAIGRILRFLERVYLLKLS